MFHYRNPRLPKEMLTIFPNELLLIIGDNLSQRDLSSLIRTCKFMRLLFNDRLYKNTVRDNGNATLFWACAKGVPAVAEKVLRLGAAAETFCSHYTSRIGTMPIPETPLLSAIQHDELEVVRVLLNHGVNINLQGRLKQNPLEVATREGKEEIVRLLLDKNADVNQVSNRSMSPLHSAVLRGAKHHGSLIRLLLERGAKVDALDEDLASPLHLANDRETAELLLSYNANPNLANRQDHTPLSIAVKSKDKAWVRLLLERGALVNHQNRRGQTALFFVGKLPESYRIPQPKPTGDDPDDEIAKTLIDFGANIHMIDHNSSTALFPICGLGNIKTIKLLLDLGCNAKVRNRKGLTPLHVAAEEGWPEVLKILLEAGANINATNYYRSSALHRLTSVPKRRVRPTENYDRYCDALKVLVDFGANLNLQDRIGQTPLMKSTYHGYYRFVKILRAAERTNFILKDRRGKTAADLCKDSGLEGNELRRVTAEAQKQEEQELEVKVEQQ